MNFVEAAVALLQEQNEPLPVERLCQLALDRGLIEKPGSAPLRSMKGRLTTELKRGVESRLVRLDGDLWTLAESEGDVRGGAGATEPAGAAADAGEPVGERPGLDDEAELDGEDELGDEDEELDGDDDDDDLDDDDDDEAELDDLAADAGDVAASPAPALEIEDEDEDEDEDTADDVEDEFDDEPETEVRLPMTAEEIELHAVYGDEPASTTPAADLAEYRDAQTADEDRPMLPEILPDRRRGRDDVRRRGRDRDGRRDQRRPERERGGGDATVTSGGAGAAEPAASRGGPSIGESSGGASVGEFAAGGQGAPGPGAGLAEQAIFVLASIKGAQPVPVRQLAQMMRKRRLVDDDPEKVWRPLKAALLFEQQRRQASGLSARIIYRGRDLFAYRGHGGAVDAAEAQLERAMAALAHATEAAMLERVGDLQLGAFEQLAHLYLTAVGSGIGRATPGSSEPILVGVRAGKGPVDRRGVGELRAGVQAKNASRGLLLAAGGLGAEAESEMARPGKPLAVLAGPALAAALVRLNVGVQVRSVPIGFLDGDLFDRLGDV